MLGCEVKDWVEMYITWMNFMISGLNCEVSTSYCNIHEEVTSDPPACKNGGVCRGLINNFTCDCAPGYEGKISL